MCIRDRGIDARYMDIPRSLKVVYKSVDGGESVKLVLHDYETQEGEYYWDDLFEGAESDEAEESDEAQESEEEDDNNRCSACIELWDDCQCWCSHCWRTMPECRYSCEFFS